MKPPDTILLRAEIRHERDVVLARQRARHIAALLGFDAQDQTRIATSVSEIARNAFQYAHGGRLAFLVTGSSRPAFLVRVSDEGPGIPELERVLDGTYQSPTGMGLGLVGARRLVELFDIRAEAGQGTVVTLGKPLPDPVPLTPARYSEITAQLLAAAPQDPLEELQARNHELLRTLDELQARQVEIERLNGELAETNRGVLALYAELDDRAMQLAHVSDLKSRFLSGISHELRTPLNAVHNLTRLLLDRLDGELTEEQERQVRMIRNAAAALTEMVNDLLDLARIEAGKSVLRLSDFSVSELLSTIRGMLRPLLTTDAVALVVDAADPEWRIYSDEGRVAQILRNLVSNAVKFTERGEIRVTVTYDSDADSFVFAVRDTGIGIAPEHMESIFEEYVQVDSLLQRRATGTGLGLPLSRKLAALLGGTLSAESRVGHGSTFHLVVPRICPDAVVTAEQRQEVERV
ncbi:MAG: ATP-binding protein [Gemmatimonadota bacterium]